MLSDPAGFHGWQLPQAFQALSRESAWRYLYCVALLGCSLSALMRRGKVSLASKNVEEASITFVPATLPATCTFSGLGEAACSNLNHGYVLQILQSAPAMGGYVMDLFAARERRTALLKMMQA